LRKHHEKISIASNLDLQFVSPQRLRRGAGIAEAREAPRRLLPYRRLPIRRRRVIPAAMTGWDPRTWNETEPNTGELMWCSRTPQDVATFVSDAIAWTSSNPELRPEPSPTPLLVLIEGWNEFGEGSHIIPTVGEGASYGDAIGALLQEPRLRRDCLTARMTIAFPHAPDGCRCNSEPSTLR